MDAFQTILKFFMNRKTAIGYSFMALLTMGGERVFSLVAFRCPCSNENFSKSEKCFEELHKVACDKSSLPFSESDELKRTLQAQSQILGWCVIVTTALLSLLTTCCASCQSKVSHLQLMFWRVYEGTEKEQLEQIFQLYATKLSERNLKCFFENKEPEPISLPAFQAWEDASQLYSFSSSKQHYSTIHRLVEEGQKGSSEEGETMLDFADRREIP
ncbi:calcium homeostasis modulator protein 5 isoform X4 [Hirundo rustica]|uniref:calcium homeostasis modulator protein 5 isoform X4 n=1 Tax=Hirundo rustica TaxID=43150 RepID=UPI001A952C29|nr:calcium homeostasis modulator protein 5 isoform X4 [Hirundo rustica]